MSVRVRLAAAPLAQRRRDAVAAGRALELLAELLGDRRLAARHDVADAVAGAEDDAGVGEDAAVDSSPSITARRGVGKASGMASARRNHRWWSESSRLCAPAAAMAAAVVARRLLRAPQFRRRR